MTRDGVSYMIDTDKCKYVDFPFKHIHEYNTKALRALLVDIDNEIFHREQETIEGRGKEEWVCDA